MKHGFDGLIVQNRQYINLQIINYLHLTHIAVLSISRRGAMHRHPAGGKIPRYGAPE